MKLFYKLFGYQPRPWGYEVKAVVWDERFWKMDRSFLMTS